MSADNHGLRAVRQRGALLVYRHTYEQIHDRYGLRLTAAEYLGLCDAIARDLAGLDAEPCGDDRYRVVYAYRRRRVLFVFESCTGLIITALPREGGSTEPVGMGRYITAAGRRRKLRGPSLPPKGPKYPPDWVEEWDR